MRPTGRGRARLIPESSVAEIDVLKGDVKVVPFERGDHGLQVVAFFGLDPQPIAVGGGLHAL